MEVNDWKHLTKSQRSAALLWLLGVLHRLDEDPKIYSDDFTAEYP